VLVTIDDQLSGPIAEGSAEAARPRSAGRLGQPWGEVERVNLCRPGSYHGSAAAEAREISVAG